MSIQVVIYFWPNKNMGFGHIAASVYEIIDDKVTREEYISWCHGNNKKYDLKKYGDKHLVVKLPKHNNIDFKNFLTQYIKTEYFSNFQLTNIFNTLKKSCNSALNPEKNISNRYESFISESANNLASAFTDYCDFKKKPPTEPVFKEFLTEKKNFFFQNIKAFNDWNNKISVLENIKNLIRSNLDIYFLNIKHIVETYKSTLLDAKNKFKDNKFNRIINVYNKYNFISNNCAHAIERMLSITGYNYKANPALFLTPKSTFDSACELALALQNQVKKNIEVNKIANYFDKIKQLIKKDIEILQIGIPRISKIKKIEVLNKLIAIQNIDELSKQLIIESHKYKKISESFSKLLLNYLSHIPSTDQKTISDAEIKIHIALDRMLDKANLLEKQGNKTKDTIISEAARVAKQLVTDLRNKTNTYFSQIEKSNTSNLDIFKRDCKQIIDKAETILTAHRGWKHILAAVALTIATLGVGSLVVCLINKISTGRFSFFHTQSHTKLINIEKTIQRVDEYTRHV